MVVVETSVTFAAIEPPCQTMEPLAEASDTRRRHTEHPEAIDRIFNPVGVADETLKDLSNTPCFIVAERPSVPVSLAQRPTRLVGQGPGAPGHLAAVRPLKSPPEQPGAEQGKKRDRSLNRQLHGRVQPVG
jgi:hypothetical protein